MGRVATQRDYRPRQVFRGTGTQRVGEKKQERKRREISDEQRAKGGRGRERGQI